MVKIHVHHWYTEEGRGFNLWVNGEEIPGDLRFATPEYLYTQLLNKVGINDVTVTETWYDSEYGNVTKKYKKQNEEEQPK